MAKIIRKRVWLSNGPKRQRRLLATFLGAKPAPPAAQVPNTDFVFKPNPARNPLRPAKIDRGRARKRRLLLSQLWLAGRSSTVNVPDVRNILLPSAESVLTNAGLGFEIQYTPSLTFAFNVVIFQTPVPGVPVAVGTVIKLLVSSGAAIVPQEIGRAIALATADVIALGLLPTVTFKISTKFDPGTVMDQTPRVGSRVLIGSPIFFTVAVTAPPGAQRAQLPSTGDIVRVVTTTE